jgi:hypothetical protein
MVQLEWDDYMSVGVPEIDEQHRNLIAAINRLYEVVMKGDLREMHSARQKALDDLDEYVRHHFPRRRVSWRTSPTPASMSIGSCTGISPGVSRAFVRTCVTATSFSRQIS